MGAVYGSKLKKSKTKENRGSLDTSCEAFMASHDGAGATPVLFDYVCLFIVSLKDIFFIAVTVYDVTICQMFQLVCQWVQCRIFPVFSFQCLSEQIIADVRVLGGGGGREGGSLLHFCKRLLRNRICRCCPDHRRLCRRVGAFSDVGAAAMVFKSYNRGVEEWAVQDECLRISRSGSHSVSDVREWTGLLDVFFVCFVIFT